jgi:hypothetical protein
MSPKTMNPDPVHIHLVLDAKNCPCHHINRTIRTKRRSTTLHPNHAYAETTMLNATVYSAGQIYKY